jgi:hypothetical protein
MHRVRRHQSGRTKMKFLKDEETQKPFPPKDKEKCPVCRGIGEVKDFYGEWIICPQCWNRNKD